MTRTRQCTTRSPSQAQQVAQHEPAHEAGRPGQQHLPHLGDRHRGRRIGIAHGAANERPQAVQVALALRRQRAGKRRYSPVGCDCWARHNGLGLTPCGTQVTLEELKTKGEIVH